MTVHVWTTKSADGYYYVVCRECGRQSKGAHRTESEALAAVLALRTPKPGLSGGGWGLNRRMRQARRMSRH